MYYKHLLKILTLSTCVSFAQADDLNTGLNELNTATINNIEASDSRLLLQLKSKEQRSSKDLSDAEIFAKNGLKELKNYRFSPHSYCVAIDYANRKKMTKQAKGRVLLNKINSLMDTGDFEYVEADCACTTSTTPTDSSFTDGTLWGLNNTGQLGGVAGVDINVVSAWETTRGSSDVVVAVIDTGIRYTHQDLAQNMWTNSAELNGTPGVDDDGNGFIDDIYGCDPLNNDGDPFDDNNHGTHVAGTIAATADNTGRTVGVAPGVKLMACKFLPATGGGSISGAITCIEYSVDMGADILNNSWGSQSPLSFSLNNAIEYANQNDVLFVAAAGNDAQNNDSSSFSPSNAINDNVISVAAINRSGNLAGFSNYGANNVDIAAPGVSIHSSIASNDNRYANFNGTSMAAPHVAGVAALLKSHYPNITIAQYRSSLLETTTPLASLAGRVATGGIVNATAALNSLPSLNKIVTLRKRNATQFGIDGNHGAANGQNVYLWNYNPNHVNQQFEEIERGNGFFSYKKVNTNHSIDGGNGGSLRQNVHLWLDNSSNFNQHWKKVSVGGSAYKLIKRNASFAIDGSNGGARGQNVALWRSNSSHQNLQWIIQ